MIKVLNVKERSDDKCYKNGNEKDDDLANNVLEPKEGGSQEDDNDHVSTDSAVYQISQDFKTITRPDRPDNQEKISNDNLIGDGLSEDSPGNKEDEGNGVDDDDRAPTQLPPEILDQIIDYALTETDLSVITTYSSLCQPGERFKRLANRYICRLPRVS